MSLGSGRANLSNEVGCNVRATIASKLLRVIISKDASSPGVSWSVRHGDDTIWVLAWHVAMGVAFGVGCAVQNDALSYISLHC